MEQKVSSFTSILCVCVCVCERASVIDCHLTVLCCLYHSWDEWVPESRVLKYVDSNLAKQKELQKANQ